MCHTVGTYLVRLLVEGFEDLAVGALAQQLLQSEPLIDVAARSLRRAQKSLLLLLQVAGGPGPDITVLLVSYLYMSEFIDFVKRIVPLKGVALLLAVPSILQISDYSYLLPSALPKLLLGLPR